MFSVCASEWLKLLRYQEPSKLQNISTQELATLTNKWIPELGGWYLGVLLRGLWDNEIEFINAEQSVIEKLKQRGLQLKDLHEAVIDYFITSMTDDMNNAEVLERIIEIAPDQEALVFHEITSRGMVHYRKMLPSFSLRGLDFS